MPMTHTETIGFCSQVIQLLEENAAKLQAEGIDVSNWIIELNNKKNLAITKNAAQDELKTQLKIITAEAQDAIDDTYKSSSSRLDIVVGALGKTTPAAKQAAKLRSSIKKKTRREPLKG